MIKKEKIKRTPVKKTHKSVKRTPVLSAKTKSKIKRTPVINPENKSKNRAPLAIVKKEPWESPKKFVEAFNKASGEAKKELLKSLSNEVGFLENLSETNLSPTRLYYFQQEWMLDRNKYRHIDKSRQIGGSYGFAGEGLAKSHLLNIYTGIFVSYNQSEANEKIVYARTLYESLPTAFKKKLTVDRITALEFDGKLPDGRQSKTRLISHPQRQPRGKGFNTDVFLDEIAHYQWANKIYVAALPIITRGLGQLTLGSSPLGKSGLHHEIGTNYTDYPTYSRFKIYWWNNPDFVKEKYVNRLSEVHERAMDMETEERVRKFGTESILGAFLSSTEEEFGQEYELEAIDESVSYYTLDLINSCTFESLMGCSTIEDEDLYGDNPTYIDPVYKDVNFKEYNTIEELSRAIFKGEVGRRLFAGYDVGRNEDNAEVVIIEELPDHEFLQIVRHIMTMKKTEFRKQFQEIAKMFTLLPINKLRIDSTAIGANIAEDLQKKFHSRVEDIVFTNMRKQELASVIKLRMEDRTLAIPARRDLIRQIHSIKRKVSQNSSVVFVVDDTESTKKSHHGDKFWALALASSCGRPPEMYRVTLMSNRIGVPTKKRIVSSITENHSRIIKSTPLVVNGYESNFVYKIPFHKTEFLHGKALQ